MNNKGKTPISCAVKRCHIDILYTLLEYSEDKGISIFDDSILIYAIKQGAEHTVRFLCNNGVDVNDPDSNGISPISHAVLSGRKDIVSILIEYGCDVNLRDNEEKTALHYAYEKGDENIIDYLINNGSNEKQKDYIQSIFILYFIFIF